MDDGTAVVLAASIPAITVLIGVVWQARKTRSEVMDRGTSEHLMARTMLLEHGEKLTAIAEDVRDVKADVRDVKADVRSLDGRVVSLEDGAKGERKTILAAVEEHDLGDSA